MAFDAGLFSFRDFKMSNKESKNNIFVLITNPKSLQFKTKNNREPLHRVKYSTHIRFLVFSKHAVLSAKVFINDISVGKARQHNSSELFVLEWNPKLYSNGVHKINIVVQVNSKKIKIFRFLNNLKNNKLKRTRKITLKLCLKNFLLMKP